MQELFNFDPRKSITKNGESMQEEYWADWFTQYRLKGPKGVPEDILTLFRGIKK